MVGQTQGVEQSRASLEGRQCSSSVARANKQTIAVPTHLEVSLLVSLSGSVEFFDVAHRGAEHQCGLRGDDKTEISWEKKSAAPRSDRPTNLNQ